MLASCNVSLERVFLLCSGSMNAAMLLQTEERPPIFFDGWYSIRRTALLATVTFTAIERDKAGERTSLVDVKGISSG